jgi:spermidine synthase
VRRNNPPGTSGIRWALGVVGFTSMVGQLVLMRELVAVFYGNELVFGLILAAWMMWVAVGSWGLGRWVTRRGLGAGALAASAVLAAVILPLQIAMIRAVRDWLGITPGAFADFGQMVQAILVILAPLCLSLGCQFTLGAALVAMQRDEEGRSVGVAYTAESLGAVLGGALFSFALVFLLDPFQIALGLSALNLATAAIVGRGAQRRILWAGLLALAALTLVAAWPLGSYFHQATLARQWPNLIATVDTRYGRLVVTQQGEQSVFYENGLLMFETQGTFDEEVAHLPLLMHPAPSRVLLLGGGVSGVLREALKHPVDEIVYVELDPAIIQVAASVLPPEEAAALTDPRVRLVSGDGRRFVDTTGETFDVVIVDLPEPSTGQINRFYTREFFARAERILAPGGVFSIGLPSGENYWNPEMARRNASVFRTLHDVFPYVVVTPGDHNFYLASDAPLPEGAAPLVERFVARGIETQWVQPPYLEWLFTTGRYTMTRGLLESETGARLNDDLMPICYYYDFTVWLTMFGTGFRGVFETAELLHLWWLLPPLLIAALVLRRRPRPAVASMIGWAGFAMMSLEIVLLFTFQALHGYVYYAVGLIVTAFMGGLALGAALAQRIGQARVRPALLGVLAGIALYAGLLPLAFRISLPAPHLTFSILALLAGSLGGLTFALAARLAARLPGAEASAVAGLLYGSDLVGGCIGALLTSVFIVPLFGIPQTCWATASVGLISLILCTGLPTPGKRM